MAEEVLAAFRRHGTDAGWTRSELIEVLRKLDTSLSQEALEAMLLTAVGATDGSMHIDTFVQWLYEEEDDVESRREVSPVPAGAPPDETFADLVCGGAGCRIELTEHRGMQLRQLFAVYAHISRRCEAECWCDYKGVALTKKQVSLYETCKHVIKPATQVKQVSYVELVSVSAQPPSWFVSHWWGEPVVDFVACLEQHARDHWPPPEGSWEDHAARLGQMDEFAIAVVSREAYYTLEREDDTRLGKSYWVCAYANNQWRLDQEVVDDPEQTSFRKALALADGAVSVLDRGGRAFTRVWCCYEIFVATAGANDDFKYEIYAAHDHEFESHFTGGHRSAVGLVHGKASGVHEWPILSQVCEDLVGSKVQRESHFPLDIAERALAVELQKAEASVEADRVRILNAIVGRPRGCMEVPLLEHPSYEQLNGVLRGRFAAAALRPMLDAGRSIHVAAPLLVRSGILRLELNFENCAAFDASAAEALFRNLPEGLQSLKLPKGGLTPTHVAALGEGVSAAVSLTELDLQNNCIGDAGARALGPALAGHRCLASLNLSFAKQFVRCEEVRTAEGFAALAAGLRWNASLTELSLRGNCLGDQGAVALAEALVASSCQLRCLDVGDNDVGAVGAEALGAVCAASATLTSVDSWGPLMAGWDKIVAGVCRNRCSSVASIHLPELGSAGELGGTLVDTRALGEALRDAVSPALASVTLSRVELWREVYVEDAPSKVQGDCFDRDSTVIYEGTEMIVVQNKKDRKTGQQVLGMVSKVDKSAGVAAFAEAICCNMVLTELKLDHTGLDDAGKQSLQAAAELRGGCFNLVV